MRRPKAPSARRWRRGQSLLEVIAASTIIATTLVPALRMMRDSLRVSREIETAELLTTLCVSKLEEVMARSSTTWEMQTLNGDYAALGRSDIRYTAIRSDDVVAGGLRDELMGITVIVWHDRNGNGRKDGAEPGVTFATKISKLLGYQALTT
jgi:hypothetical protein